MPSVEAKTDHRTWYQSRIFPVESDSRARTRLHIRKRIAVFAYQSAGGPRRAPTSLRADDGVWRRARLEIECGSLRGQQRPYCTPFSVTDHRAIPTSNYDSCIQRIPRASMTSPNVTTFVHLVCYQSGRALVENEVEIGCNSASSCGVVFGLRRRDQRFSHAGGTAMYVDLPPPRIGGARNARLVSQIPTSTDSTARIDHDVDVDSTFDLDGNVRR